MHLVVIFRVLGVMLMAFSFTLTPSCLLAIVYDDGGLLAFGIAFGLTLLTGLLFWFPLRQR